jgi:hypothetical protein
MMSGIFRKFGTRLWRDKLMLCAILIVLPVWIILFIRATTYGSIHAVPFHVCNMVLIGLGILTGVRADKMDRRGKN